jgi:hypothetical protein
MDILLYIEVVSANRKAYGPKAMTHYSNIPAFHHSNVSETLNFVIS